VKRQIQRVPTRIDEVTALQDAVQRWSLNVNSDLYEVKTVYYNFTVAELVGTVLTINHNSGAVKFASVAPIAAGAPWFIVESNQSYISIDLGAAVACSVKLEW
jgi:hypothetical protein